MNSVGRSIGSLGTVERINRHANCLQNRNCTF